MIFQIKIIGVYLTRKYYFNRSAPKCHVYFTGMSLFLIVVLLFNFFNQLNIVNFYTSKTHNNKSIAVKKNSLSETANTCYMKHEHEKQIVCTEFVLN